MRKVRVDPAVLVVFLVEVLEFNVVELTWDIEDLAGSPAVTDVDIARCFVRG
mgnify:CR=1 FL=1